jgi:hypothetical protein
MLPSPFYRENTIQQSYTNNAGMAWKGNFLAGQKSAFIGKIMLIFFLSCGHNSSAGANFRREMQFPG